MNREKLKPKVSCSNAKIWGLWKEYQLCSHFLNAVLITGLDNSHNKIVMARRKDRVLILPSHLILSVAFSIASHSAALCNLKHSSVGFKTLQLTQLATKGGGGGKTQMLPCPPSPGPGSTAVLLQLLLEAGDSLSPTKQGLVWVAGDGGIPRLFWHLGTSDLHLSLVWTDFV